MDLPPLTYLTFDEVGRGVGASQVVPYVERLAATGLEITLHSYEQTSPTDALRRRLRSAGVDWRTHAFRAGGARSALRRIAGAARFVRGAELVHARSDLPAAAAMLGRADAWLWDVRSFWIDQRIALGLARPNGSLERAMRRVEAAAAHRSTAITTLTGAAIDVLAERHGAEVRAKAVVVPTCTDLRRFTATPMPSGELTLMLSGTFNELYDRAKTFALVDAVSRRTTVRLFSARPRPGTWDADVEARGGALVSAPYEDMPELVAKAHAGLCICRIGHRLAIVAAAPTKIAEHLAAGRPVVVNRGLGDMDDHIAASGCGVVVDTDVEAAADQLIALLADPATPGRCRRVAEDVFSLDVGIERLLGCYRRAVHVAP
ncbi:MAG: hypothetical protein M3Z46_05730 [Actinomycetota bacterium]|nr:hypothetical protein [Actinomycetota bacterium]